MTDETSPVTYWAWSLRFGETVASGLRMVEGPRAGLPRALLPGVPEDLYREAPRLREQEHHAPPASSGARCCGG
ncbi:hypothetical protein [Streptomyces sp. NBC_00474]|uniref:hypothetical protein n=1 Tax=Streptomyces sp. NBC_00474 TaxID=2975754 RepID=UPI0022514E38|nr:hypothetical protein [Streptomyces sp. NBC_00474]MCX5055063.1 hypothetical protein [Streptomyces sp. NBC_00474]